MKQNNLRSSISLMKTGEALTCSFVNPKALFFGYIPRQMAVIWKYPNQEELHVQRSGYTYFTWSHSCETLVNIGLVSHLYIIGHIVVEVTFHIFDPIKFTTLTTVDLFNESLEMFLTDMFKGKENGPFETPEFYKYLSEKFVEANKQFQPLGVGITAIDPPGFNNNTE